MIVEEYVPGVEVALEGLLRDGALEVLAVFDKPDPLDGPYFEETIYVTPSRLPAATLDAPSPIASERAARAIGLTEGPVHAEVRGIDAADRSPIASDSEVAARRRSAASARARSGSARASASRR